MENLLLRFYLLSHFIYYVISLFPKNSFSNDVDFVNFNDRLTVALLLLVFLSCVIEKTFLCQMLLSF